MLVELSNDFLPFDIGPILRFQGRLPPPIILPSNFLIIDVLFIVSERCEYGLSFVQTLQYSTPFSPPYLSVYLIAEPRDILTSPSWNILLVWSITFATCERAAPPSDGIESNISCVVPNMESDLKPYFVDKDSVNADALSA